MVPNNANTYLPGTVFIPSSMIITSITNTFPMVVTAILNPVTEANTYLTGMLIRLFVPIQYGMFQANGLTGQIIAINGLQFTLNVDASQFDPFVIPSPNDGIQPANLTPAGSQNLQYDNTTGLVAFQPLNDLGN